MKGPLCLIIMDGWGINPRSEGNAIALAKTQVLDSLSKEYPTTTLSASGLSVGLPKGQMGNSEVGHLNIGAGRIVYQDFTRISKAVEEGDFFRNQTILDAVSQVKANGSSLHLMGLLSDGGVHSHIDHLFALIDMAKRNGVERLFIHAFLDGRDTPPRSALTYMESTEAYIKRIGLGEIATVSGRYYAMDRDKRWERVKRAYDAIVLGEGMEADSPLKAVEDSYAREEGDEFVQPTVIKRNGAPVARLSDRDAVIFFNFRTDRTREITRSLTHGNFDGFERRMVPALSSFVCMTEYDETFGLPVAFPPVKLTNIFGDVTSRAGLRQLRIAETEKYAHVTFFFNGGVEEPYPNEDRRLIPSPKDVPTYDLKPEMSAFEVTKEVLSCIESGNYDCIILNYANGDMVGHTGFLDAAKKAVEAVDACVGLVVNAVKGKGGKLLITADHGNAEQMIDYDTGEPHTAHTSNPVPFILVDDESKNARLREGILADIAPTMLEILGLPVPQEMEGRSLIL
jgi:2,3-bisphosphoglycerate-independent phosphoglycerate mutase